MTTSAPTPVSVALLQDMSTIGPNGEIGDTTWQAISGVRCVLEWVVRAWFSPRGSMRWCPHRGVDLTQLENGVLSPGDLVAWRGKLIAEARAVDYVLDARVLLGWDESTGTTSIQAGILIDAGTGPRVYPLAISISSAGATAAFGLLATGGTT